jgi:integrase
MHAQARGTDYEAMLLLNLSMPLRPCELFGLRRADVSIARREAKARHDLIETKKTAYVPTLGPEKTDESRRELPLSDEVAAALSKRLEGQLRAGRTTPESFIFTSRGGCRFGVATSPAIGGSRCSLDVFHLLCGHRSIASSLKHDNRPEAAARSSGCGQRVATARGRRIKPVVTRPI